jgi:hypothetical protein
MYVSPICVFFNEIFKWFNVNNTNNTNYKELNDIIMKKWEVLLFYSLIIPISY